MMPVIYGIYFTLCAGIIALSLPLALGRRIALPDFLRIPALPAALAAAGALLLFFRIGGFMPPGGWSGAAVAVYLCAVFMTAAALFYPIIIKKWLSRNQRREHAGLLRFFTVACLIIALLEIFLFNCNSYVFRGEQIVLPVSQAVCTGVQPREDDSIIAAGPCSVSVEYSGVGVPVGTLMADIELDFPLTSLKIDVDFSDATSQGLRTGIASFTVIPGMDKSRYMPCHFSGAVDVLKLRFRLEEGQSLYIGSITVNAPIPFSFSLLRTISLLGTALAMYALTRLRLFRRRMDLPCTISDSHKKQLSAVVVCVTAVFVLAAFVLTAAYHSGKSYGLKDDFTRADGNQITKELVDAFEHGQLSLLDLPSQALLEMDNPYDLSARSSLGIDYKWDHLLYNGKYYSYYGIAPVILLFLPYHVITGYYFPTVWAVFLFGAVGIIFLSLLYCEVIRRWFRSLPFGMSLAGLIIIQASAGIWTCFSSTLFYEIAQLSGFMFVVMGAYFLISSGLMSYTQLSAARIAMGTAALGLAVMCRPTCALYAVISLLFIWFGFRRRAKAGGAGWIPLLCAALIPYILLGGVQMWYNYARFGSPLEFGIQYTLTIYDYSNIQFHPRLTAIGFYNCLFAFPQFKPEFPFFHNQYTDLDVNGYYFVATSGAIGIFWRALPTFGLFFAGRARRLMKPDTRTGFSVLWSAACIAAPLVIVFMMWEYGFAFRYAADFSWQMVLGALAVLFILYMHCKNPDLKRLAYKAMIMSVLLSIAVNAAIILIFMEGGLSYDARVLYYTAARIFEFWK